MNVLGIILNVVILLLILSLIVLQMRYVRKNRELKDRLEVLEKIQTGLAAQITMEITALSNQENMNAKNAREETATSLMRFQNSILARMSDIAGLQKSELEIFSRQLSSLIQTTEDRLDKMRATVENQLKFLQEDNQQKLEQMRATVDEKLHDSLEKRLGESFQLVSQRLEMVHQGLGEMQNLAVGVGDLKKVLSNVKTRGIWGEIQLAAILEEILTPEQYATNVATRPGSNERVEFAVKLPGKHSEKGSIWLPIDAKFPQEDYLRLMDATLEGNLPQAEEAAKQLTNRIKQEAKNIRDKYLEPPHTTDFGIMFLPTESLYAEVVKQADLLSVLQRDYRVIVTGPSTMAALLNSLAIGFKTMAIEKRSSEVWQLLGVVKTEFTKFGEILDKTRKKLDEASSSLETASRKTRNIERRLQQVQETPVLDDSNMKGLENLEEELA